MKWIYRALLPMVIAASPILAQNPDKPVVSLSCIADNVSPIQGESVNLMVSLENSGASDFYIYHTLEWGWAGIRYSLTNDRGDMVYPKEHIIPPPPPPIYDKSQLVGLAPGYFFGTHLVVNLSNYMLSPGAYYLQVSYKSNYTKKSGFGLPILTTGDGEFSCKKILIDVLPKGNSR